MTDIAKDGDLGALGTDNIGDAALGVSVENLAAFKAALHEFHNTVADLAAAQNQAENAVNVLNSWVTVGQKAVDIILPMVQTLVAKHVAEHGQPDANSGALPGPLGKLTGIAEELDKFRNGIAGGLAGLFPKAV